MRRIMNRVKKFWKNVLKSYDDPMDNVETIMIEIIPTRRDINYTKLMPTTETAQTLYDFIYNKYVFHMSKYEREKAETYKDLMIEIKQLSEKSWHQIKL